MSPCRLAALEGVAVFGGVSAMTALWIHPAAADTGRVVLELLLQASVLSFWCIVSFYYHDLYDFQAVRNFETFVVCLLQSLGVAFILMAMSYMLLPDTNMPNGPFVSSVLVIVGVLIPLRAITYAIMRSRSRTDRLLLMGAGPLASQLIREIQGRPDAGTVVGVVQDGGLATTVPGDVPVFGSADDMAKVIQSIRPNRIIVTLSERRGRLPVNELLEAQADGVRVQDGVEVYENLAGKVALESLRPSNLLFSSDFRKSPLQLAVGRAISVAVALTGLVATAPLMALFALAVKLESPGPVFFRQQRVGLRGRAFTLIKFRTMRVGSAASEWVGDNESRITTVGRILRKFRLDELPQFLNILKGDMNLVGPRPHPVSNFQLFVERIPYYGLRATVRPGVTGWAQIRYGYANNLEEETEKMRYDLYYIKRLSLWFDLRILFDTVKVMLLGKGAVPVDTYRPAPSLAVRPH
jgi:exopolysaccharide biosynthesis polyprenyl glycosylphosphotransferase